MELPNASMWMCRAEWEGTVLHHFLHECVAYLGWNKTGVIHPETTRQELRGRVERANPTMRPNAIGNSTRCIWEFCREVQIGDTLVTYNPQERLYHVGVVRSDAEYDETGGIWVDPVTMDEYAVPRYVRKVDWGPTVSRDRLSPAAQRYLGRPPTLFQLPAEIAEEIRRLCG